MPMVVLVLKFFTYGLFLVDSSNCIYTVLSHYLKIIPNGKFLLILVCTKIGYEIMATLGKVLDNTQNLINSH